MHEAAFVILTPEYGTSIDCVYESLYEFSEDNYIDSYFDHFLSDVDKINFLMIYANKSNREYFFNKLNDYEHNQPDGITYEKYTENDHKLTQYSYMFYISCIKPQDYITIFKQLYNSQFKNFSYYAKKYGNDFDGGYIEYDKRNRKYAMYYPCNNNSYYDWYEIGGRWDKSLLTLNGEKVTSCLLSEVDWNHSDNTVDNFTFGKGNLPENMFVDGEVHHIYDIDEFKELPKDTMIYIIDYHY